MRKFILTALLLCTALLPAQSKPSKAQSAERLSFTLILSRHGIRPPLAPNTILNPRSADPWPEWEVPLGYLTPHGAEALRQMGSYLRSDFAASGLLPAKGCPADNAIYIYADTDERNIMSSFHTFAAFEPGCKPRAIHTVPLKAPRDPLFSPTHSAFPAPSAEAVAADRRAVTGPDDKAYFSVAANPGLNELAKILAPDPAHPAAKPVLAEPRPLQSSAALIEDLFLEYIDAKPFDQVGWGRVNADALHRLMRIHAKEAYLAARTPLSARSHGSNLMAHILSTLEQASDPAHPAIGAIGPADARFVYVSGHDTNLHNLAGLLGLHWTTEGISDDTPPDSQLVFELWQNPRTKQFSVRLLYRAQTFDQLRVASQLSKTHPPDEVVLTAPGCNQSGLCPLANFDKAVHNLLDPAYVQAEMPVLQVTPPTN